MDEENLNNDAESVEASAASAAVPEAGEAAAGELTEEVEALSGKVESAVAHVAEEAKLEDNKVEDIAKDLTIETAVEEEAEPAMEVAADSAASEPAPKKRERRSKQARAEKEERASATAATHAAAPVKAKKGLAALSVPAWLGISAACLVLGLALGHFAFRGGAAAGGTALAGKTTVAESELDNAYATYTYKGATNTITIREVIEQNGTVDAAKTADGTYTVPSAEYALNVARTAILNSEVESRGITVTDEDVTEYAKTALGTDDFDAIASTYGMDADEVKKLIEENCKITALREEVVGGELPEMPESPTAPAEGSEDQVTKEYADYIIKLAGDAWNSKKGEWADKDGAYATALADATFSADGATYSAAQSAYYVAYQEYSTKQSEMSTKWAEFLNGLLSNATIQVGTLASS